jgi:hypothetical protein
VIHEAAESTSHLNVMSDPSAEPRAASIRLLFRKRQLMLEAYWKSENICMTEVLWGREMETDSQIHLSLSTKQEYSGIDKVKFVCQNTSGVSNSVICNYIFFFNHPVLIILR